MGKKYNNYSKNFVANKEKVVENTTLEQQPENDVETTTLEQQPENDVEVETQVPVVAVIGVVSGCVKLNVRKGPSKETDPVAVIDKGYELVIEEELSDWYKVKIAGGIIGYCMAEFITIP